MLNILYAGEYKAMMPKLKSKNFKNMELIRPLYYIKEEDIITWARYNKNINIDAVLGYKSKNLKYNFLDDYEERNIFDE